LQQAPGKPVRAVRYILLIIWVSLRHFHADAGCQKHSSFPASHPQSLCDQFHKPKLKRTTGGKKAASGVTDSS
jgi:hypothetical protein